MRLLCLSLFCFWIRLIESLTPGAVGTGVRQRQNDRLPEDRASAVQLVRLADERENALLSLVGLRDHRGRRLAEDLCLGEVGRFR